MRQEANDEDDYAGERPHHEEKNRMNHVAPRVTGPEMLAVERERLAGEPCVHDVHRLGGGQVAVVSDARHVREVVLKEFDSIFVVLAPPQVPPVAGK